MNRAIRTVPFLTLLLPLAAQDQATPDLTRLLSELLVPIHTQAADPEGGEYGIWCAGPDYKASFHDGFAFHPHLGPEAPEHLPLHWRTESIAVGKTLLPLEGGRSSWRGQRFERRVGSVIEAYEARREGVEQTFTLLQRPAGEGDLVITGRIDTKLSCAASDAAVQDLVFTSSGKPVVRYGRALAIDANGRRCDVATSWDGARIRLVLAASFLQEAAFPLVVDPLTASVVLFTHTNSLSPGEPTIAAETNTRGPKLLIAFSRKATAVDSDMYALVTSSTFTQTTWIYQDVTTGWSSVFADAAYVGAAGKWALAFQRNFTASTNVRVYLADSATATLNSGTVLFLPTPGAGIDNLNCSIGGSMSGSIALLAYERRDRTSGYGGSWGNRVNATSLTLSADLGFTGAFLEQLRGPRVTPLATHDTGWLVALKGNTLRVAKVPQGASGYIPARTLVSLGTGEFFDDGGMTTHCVAGGDGRYLLAYVSRTAPGGVYTDKLRVVRFDWNTGATSPTTLATRVIATLSGLSLYPLLRPGGCDFDQVTRSHWVLGHTDSSGSSAVSRLGHLGGVTETQVLGGGWLADVAFARPNAEGTFPIVYGTFARSAIHVVGREFRYPTDATGALYGTGCAAGVSTFSNRPYSGHEFFRVSLHGLPPGAPATFTLSSAQDSVDLGPQGMPGCFRNVALPGLATLLATADAGGRATVTFPLPELPLPIYDLFSQWSFVDASQPQPVRFSQGVRWQVR